MARQSVSLERELGTRIIPERGRYHIERFTEGDDFGYSLADEKGLHWIEVKARLIDGHYVFLNSVGEVKSVADKEKVKKLDRLMKSHAVKLLQTAAGRQAP